MLGNDRLLNVHANDCTGAVVLPWCQVEQLLVEASAAESVAELLFTEAVSEDVANTMTLAGLDVVTQVVRR